MSDPGVCDSCGAVAYWRFVFLDQSVHTFCGHHGRQFEPLLPTRSAVFDLFNIKLDSNPPT